MKDKELRNALEKDGLIHRAKIETSFRWKPTVVSANKTNFLSMRTDYQEKVLRLLLEYLGLEIEELPSKTIIRKRKKDK